VGGAPFRWLCHADVVLVWRWRPLLQARPQGLGPDAVKPRVHLVLARF